MNSGIAFCLLLAIAALVGALFAFFKIKNGGGVVLGILGLIAAGFFGLLFIVYSAFASTG